ncbi:FMN reductase [Aerococcus urinaehominis]|uniref:FMN reductase n=1 Tax=Aerococcus urinaehominis TaxID=128944 RepID=A0A0X8FL70_9LACT|nr:NADPH-dependent FMN reductase [Aerococcus urinaehominis]AMB99361.1 FMN reductase [Aerococcus urinaehominis]SDM22324.1 FMN reductase [Aerococcus urinaehominis]
MKVVAISASNIGTKTRIAIDAFVQEAKKIRPDQDISIIDLAEHDLMFADGRNFMEYPGETEDILQEIMAADALIIGSPTFQASIPATLKNIFDLLPVNALRDKTVAVIMTAGSARHYLIAETQLFPILNYMKANVVSKYVFIESLDFGRNEIINDTITFRLERLADDLFTQADTYAEIKRKKDEAYGF